MKNEMSMLVTPDHTDGQGHLNHVQALDFLMQSRIGFYEECGLSDGSGQGRFGTIVVNINVNFRKECFLGERLTVRSSPDTLGNKSFVLTQEILRPDGEVVIEGAATSVVMDMTTREIIHVPDCLARHFTTLT